MWLSLVRISSIYCVQSLWPELVLCSGPRGFSSGYSTCRGRKLVGRCWFYEGQNCMRIRWRMITWLWFDFVMIYDIYIYIHMISVYEFMMLWQFLIVMIMACKTQKAWWRPQATKQSQLRVAAAGVLCGVAQALGHSRRGIGPGGSGLAERENDKSGRKNKPWIIKNQTKHN